MIEVGLQKHFEDRYSHTLKDDLADWKIDEEEMQRMDDGCGDEWGEDLLMEPKKWVRSEETTVT